MIRSQKKAKIEKKETALKVSLVTGKTRLKRKKNIYSVIKNQILGLKNNIEARRENRDAERGTVIRSKGMKMNNIIGMSEHEKKNVEIMAKIE